MYRLSKLGRSYGISWAAKVRNAIAVFTLRNIPLRATAMLAAQFLQDQSEDIEIVREVKELLEATK